MGGDGDMRALKQKARSQKGASITFALLLFLVCAIISSVVIVAATAAAGRVSQLAQTDQKYYAVNSAAELVQNMLEKPTMTVTAGYTETTVTTVTGDSTSSSTTTEELATTVDMDMNDGTDIQPVKQFKPTSYTEDPNSPDSIVVSAALQLAGQKTNGMAATIDLSATSVAGSDGKAIPTDFLSVTLLPSLTVADQTLTVTVTTPAGVANPYRLDLTFKADVVSRNDDHVPSSSTIIISDAEGNPTGSITTTSVTHKTITTVKWKLTGIKAFTATTATPVPGDT